MDKRYAVQMSGGLGSWGAAKRIVERHGAEKTLLVFADVLIEDNDAYRLLLEGGANVMGVPSPIDLLELVDRMPEAHEDLEGRRVILDQVRTESASRFPWLHWILDGRTPHEVFLDQRMLGNSRIDPCSRILKREFLANWMDYNLDPSLDTCIVGIDWTEIHRLEPIQKRWRELGGWRYQAPLCEAPWMTKEDVQDWAKREGIRIPKLYSWGMSHNNCGGGCVKAGQGHWSRLLIVAPDRYAWWEAQEEKVRKTLGANVAMMRDRRGGTSRPLTLSEFRQRVESGEYVDKSEIGGCGCALPV